VSEQLVKSNSLKYITQRGLSFAVEFRKLLEAVKQSSLPCFSVGATSGTPTTA
jgi:hypothetical protein